MKIGVFGGTFNPIHYGHLRAAEEARETASLDKVLFVPSGNPPLKNRELADPLHRYKMAQLAVAGNPFFDVLDIESVRPGKSYTVNTIDTLLKLYPDADLYFMLGIDSFLDIPNWWRPERLVSAVNFIILSRPGCRFLDLLSSHYLETGKNLLRKIDCGEIKSISIKLKTLREAVLVGVTPLAICSTDIRRRVEGGLSIKYILPEKVESFIISNRLYIK